MKTGIKAAIGVAALAATMTTGVFVGVALADQPHMRAALDELRQARSELDRAEHNKGGHREAAIRLVDQAIDEVKMGMDDAR
ncbi:MAG TPA: hypothetical protein VG387_12625 [Rhizomicrobium sp.]|jgi:hypothetical protein|nr:hypothetical protein [Rhizomicrobium sp.]